MSIYALPADAILNSLNFTVNIFTFHVNKTTYMYFNHMNDEKCQMQVNGLGKQNSHQL